MSRFRGLVHMEPQQDKLSTSKIYYRFYLLSKWLLRDINSV